MSKLLELFNKEDQLRTEAKKAVEAENAAKFDEIKSKIDEVRAQIREEKMYLEDAEMRAKAQQGIPDESELTPIGGKLYRNGKVDKTGIAPESTNFYNKIDENNYLLKPEAKATDLYKNSNDLSLGKWFKGVSSGNWEGAERELEVHNKINTTGTRSMIPVELGAQIIEYAVNNSVLFNAGARQIMSNNGKVDLTRIAEMPEFRWKAEGAHMGEFSTMEFEEIELRAKTLYGAINFTIEADASVDDLTGILRRGIGQAIAQEIDRAVLYGTGEVQPKGVLTYNDINRIDGGAIQNYSEVIKAIGAIRRNNGEPTQWVMPANVDEAYNLLTNANGEFMMIPTVVHNLTRRISNQLQPNHAIVFDPSEVMIMIHRNLHIQLLESSEHDILHGTRTLRVYAMIDAAPLRPRLISLVQGLQAGPLLEEEVEPVAEAKSKSKK